MKRMVSLSYLFFILIFACKPADDTETLKTSQEKIVFVKTVPVSLETVNQTYKLFGEAAAYKEVDIFPRINGIVQSKKAMLGDYVQQGQSLATVKQDIPGMDFALYTIESTMAGLITMDLLEVGSTVSTQRSVYKISQQNPAVVNLNVPEDLVSKIRIGQTLRVQFESLSETELAGEIFEISPYLIQTSRSLPIKIRIDNTPYKIKPGMFARAFLDTDKREGLTIPVDALLRSGVKNYVFKVENGLAQKQLVETGILLKGRIEIVQGLMENDRIVVFGQNMLDDGIKVEEKE